MRQRRTLPFVPALAGAFFLLGGGPAAAQGPYVDLAAGEIGAHVCGLDASGNVDCAFEFGFSRTDPPSDLPALTSIDAGAVHTCGITVDGAVRCWGDDFFGQLDAPSFEQPVEQLAVGDYTGCAIDAGGTLRCWGNDDNGRASPPEPDALYTHVAVGDMYACAIKLSGETVCWGAEADGRLSPPAGVAFRELSLDADACGLTDGGEIRCWGRVDQPVPQDVPYVAVSNAFQRVHALDTGGFIDRAPPLIPNAPPELNEPPPSNGGFTAIDNSCAIDAAGEIICWGAGGPSPSARSAPAAPELVRVVLRSATAVELFWTRGPPSGGRVLGHDVYRDGVPVATGIREPIYFDDTLSPGVPTTYEIVAVSVNGLRSERSAPVTVDTAELDAGGSGGGSGYTVPARPLEPTGLRAPVYSDTTLELLWDRPARRAVGYEIRRDGLFVAFTDGTSYLDTTIEPGRRYRYDVIAIEPDGGIGGFTTIEVET